MELPAILPMLQDGPLGVPSPTLNSRLAAVLAQSVNFGSREWSLSSRSTLARVGDVTQHESNGDDKELGEEDKPT